MSGVSQNPVCNKYLGFRNDINTLEESRSTPWKPDSSSDWNEHRIEPQLDFQTNCIRQMLTFAGIDPNDKQWEKAWEAQGICNCLRNSALQASQTSLHTCENIYCGNDAGN
tara:strand:+ start:136 stop:468 length:333 start_codon:yes stop_codon:yes gene_type:complete